MDFGAAAVSPASDLFGHSLGGRMDIQLLSYAEPVQECEMCGRQFHSMWNFESHREAEGHFQPILGEPSFYRPQTGATSPARSDLRSTTIDSDISNDGSPSPQQLDPAEFSCHLCSKRYTRAHNLRAHLRNHANERPFVCGICDRAFARHHDRKTHERLHAGRPEFVCSFRRADGRLAGCGRRFARKQNLKRHLASARNQCSREPPPTRETVVNLTGEDSTSREIQRPRGNNLKDSLASGKPTVLPSDLRPIPPMKHGDAPVSVSSGPEHKSTAQFLPDALYKLIPEPPNALLECSSFGPIGSYLDELAAAGLMEMETETETSSPLHGGHDSWGRPVARTDEDLLAPHPHGRRKRHGDWRRSANLDRDSGYRTH